MRIFGINQGTTRFTVYCINGGCMIFFTTMAEKKRRPNKQNQQDQQDDGDVKILIEKVVSVHSMAWMDGMARIP